MQQPYRFTIHVWHHPVYIWFHYWKKDHHVSVALLLNFWREISTWLCGLTNSHLHKDNLVNISLLTAALWYTRKIFEDSWQESWRIANTWRRGLLTEVPLPCLHCSNRWKDLQWLHFWKTLKTVEIGSIFTILKKSKDQKMRNLISSLPKRFHSLWTMCVCIPYKYTMVQPLFFF